MMLRFVFNKPRAILIAVALLIGSLVRIAINFTGIIPEHYLMFISLLAFTVVRGSQKLHFIQEAPLVILADLKNLSSLGSFCCV
jgi:hypothetical protein